MQFLLNNQIPKDHQIIVPDEEYIEDVENEFGFKLDVLKQTPSYQQFLDMVTFKNIRNRDYNESLTGFRLYIDLTNEIVGSKAEQFKFDILSVSRRIITIDGIIITPELKTQIQNEVKTGILWTSLDQQLFERLAFETDPETVQRLCMSNRKLRSRCTQDFYQRMLMKFYNEESDDPKSRFLWHLRGKIYTRGAFNVISEEEFYQIENVPKSLTVESTNICVLDEKGKVWLYRLDYDRSFNMIDLDVKIVKIASSVQYNDYYALLLDQNGKVWSFGSNQNGQLGLGHKYDAKVPEMIPFEGVVVDIHCSGNRSSFVDSEGQIWRFGAPFNYECDEDEIELNGGSIRDYDISTPKLFPFPGKAKSFSTTQDWKVDFFIIDVEGVVWINNIVDWLGEAEFEPLDFPNPVIKIKNGVSHTLFLDSEGKVWGIGNNDHGQLGFGYRDIEGRDEYYDPTLLDFDHTIVDISCGSQHSILLDSEGKAWSFGYNEDNQLGLDIEDRIVYTPQMIPFNGRIKSISAKDECTAFIGF